MGKLLPPVCRETTRHSLETNVNFCSLYICKVLFNTPKRFRLKVRGLRSRLSGSVAPRDDVWYPGVILTTVGIFPSRRIPVPLHDTQYLFTGLSDTTVPSPTPHRKLGVKTLNT